MNSHIDISNVIIGEIENTNTNILISLKRLNELESLEKSLPTIIEKAINEHKNAKLKLLHEKDKQNPAAVNARVKRYNEKNKDKINARRLIRRKGVDPMPLFSQEYAKDEDADEKFIVRLQ